MKAKKVAVALSGGLDSAVAAAILKRQGYDVTGVHALFYRKAVSAGEGRLEADNQEELCRKLGVLLQIPVISVDLQNEFSRNVIDYFCDEYCRARTPNPCVICNQTMKFGLLMQTALSYGADLFATGHYATVSFRDCYYRLLKGIDGSKEQSYMLYRLSSNVLSRVLFPLGRRCFTEVKAMAEEYGLGEIIQQSSQDVCFIEGEYGEYVSRRYTFEHGDILDTEGKRLGSHRGIGFYTVGQRHGLGLSVGGPLYVVALDAETNAVIAGNEEELYRQRFTVADTSWVAEKPQGNIEVEVKIRYRSPAVPAVIGVMGNTAEVELRQPQRAVTPGQSAVFYSGNEVLGGGIIHG